MPTPMLKTRCISSNETVSFARDGTEDRRHVPGSRLHDDVEPLGQDARNVVVEAAARQVRHSMHEPGREDRLHGPQVGEMRIEEHVADEPAAELGQRVRRLLPHRVEKNLAGERVAVGLESDGGKTDRDVPGRDARSVQDLLAIHDADDRSRDVVLAGRVEARHLRRLAAEERRAVLAACARDALDHALDHAGLDFPGRDVVEEEERRRALDEDVVDAVVDEVGAAGVVPAHLDRHLELGPDAVRRGDEHRLAVLREIRAKEAAESADVAEDPGRERRADRRLRASERRGFGVDVDAGVGVAGRRQEIGIIARSRAGTGTSPGGGRLPGSADDPPDHVMRATLHFFVDPPEVFAHDPQEEQLEPRKKRNRHHHGREPARRMTEKQALEDHIAREQQRSEDRDEAHDGGRAQGSHGEREDTVEGQPQQLKRGVFRPSRRALSPLDGNADLLEPDPGSEAAQIPMMLGNRAQPFHNPPRKERKISRVQRKAQVREGRDHAVEEEIGRPQQHPFFPGNAAGIDDVEPFSVFVEELMDRFRRILQISVHHDDDVAGHVVQGRADGGLVAEIARKGDDDDPGVVGRGRGEQLERPVRAPVVDEDHLVRAPGQPVEDRPQPAQQLGDGLALVEERDRGGDSRLRVHALRLPLKYTLLQHVTPNSLIGNGSKTTSSKTSVNSSRHSSSGLGNSPRSHRASSRAGLGRSGRTRSTM